MHVISRKMLRQFEQKHPEARGPLGEWFHLIKRKTYQTGHDVRADFPSASFLGDRKTVFNVGGNNYRIVVHIRYQNGCVYVLDVLTHAEYTRRSRDGTL